MPSASKRTLAAGRFGSIGGVPAWAPTFPASMAMLPGSPAARYTPNYGAYTLVGSKVSQLDNVLGVTRHATQSTDANRPVLMTDGFGRKFLRFEGSQFMNILDVLGYTSARDDCVLFVGRVHRHNEFECPLFGFGNVSLASVTNTGGATLRCTAAFSTTHHMPVIAHGGIKAYDAATNAEYLVPGSQLQVIGVTSRTAALGGIRMGINRKAGLTVQNNVAGTAVLGAEIGRYPNTPGTAGNWGTFDLYELVVYSTALNNADFDTAMAALSDHYEIEEVVHQIVLEGASTIQGYSTEPSGICPAMTASEPHLGLLPRDYRLVSRAISGNQVSDLKTRRDTDPNNIYNKGKLTGGRNIVSITIGRNDMGSAGLSAATHYANVVDLIGHATDGILAQGWEVRVSHLPATSTSPQDKIDTYRLLLDNPQFLVDCAAGPGGTYDGKLGVTKQALILNGAGDTVFATVADANDLTYYLGDQTHLNAVGNTFLMYGKKRDSEGILISSLKPPHL